MTDITSVAHRSSVAATRRGYALLGMGLIIPGAAQAAHGSKRLGRFALKLWLLLIVLAILVLILTLTFRNVVIGVFANSWVLRGLAIAIVAVGLFWAVLMINTWWISRPDRMGAKKGVIFSLVTLVLAVALSVGAVWVGRAVWTTGGALGTIFAGGGTATQNKGRYNILLLGSDAGPDRTGVRPDSINVASVDAESGRTVIFGLPRNLEDVPFPESSPMHALYPDGVVCATAADETAGNCLLNAIYLLGTQNAAVYPGVADPGVQAMIDAASGVTGLSINYYAMIDMQGFQDLIDAMGGLTMTIHQRVTLDPITDLYLEPGVDRHLSGFESLWFARTRADDSDYGRMQRQRCVMVAMLRQLNPANVAAKFTELAAASGQTIRTSVPSTEIGPLAELALKARALPVQSVSFTPPSVNPASPDFTAIRQTVTDTITQAEALDEPQGDPAAEQTATVPATDPGVTQPVGAESPPAGGGNVTDDLGEVCSVS